MALLFKTPVHTLLDGVGTLHELPCLNEHFHEHNVEYATKKGQRTSLFYPLFKIVK